MTPKQAAQRLPAALAAQDWVGAHKALKLLIKADPKNASLHYNSGLVHKRRNRLRDALAAFDTALALDGGHAKALFESGTALLDLGRHHDAAQRFDLYVASCPHDPDGWRNLGRVRLHLNDAVKAQHAFEHVCRLSPNDLDAAISVAEARLRGGDATAGDRLRELYATNHEARPRILKAMHQGPRGSVPLSVSRLLS